MANENPTSSLSEYYKRFCLRLWRETKGHWGQAVIAIVAIIVTVFIQFRFGLIARDQTWSSALLNMSPSLAIALAYTLSLVIKTPWLLDVDRTQEIKNSTDQITSLRGQIETFSSEATRPKFKISTAVEGLEETDEDDRYILTLELENNGSRAALDIECQAMIMEVDVSQEPKVVDTSIGAEVEVNNSFRLQAQMRLTTLDEPPHFVVCTLKYNDAVTSKPYRQIFFRKWGGMKRGDLQGVHPLTIPERDSLKARLKSYVPEFISEGDQNVGSIPSSKID